MVGEKVTRYRRVQVGTDGANRPIWDWVAAEITGALFAPGTGAAAGSTESGAEVVTSPTLYFRGKAVDILASDRIIVRDAMYEVQGDPAVWITGTVVTIQRVHQDG